MASYLTWWCACGLISACGMRTVWCNLSPLRRPAAHPRCSYSWTGSLWCHAVRQKRTFEPRVEQRNPTERQSCREAAAALSRIKCDASRRCAAPQGQWKRTVPRGVQRSNAGPTRRADTGRAGIGTSTRTSGRSTALTAAPPSARQVVASPTSPLRWIARLKPSFTCVGDGDAWSDIHVAS